ncbi:MAG: asparagine synthase (glutamine-hydrolyzing) [Bacteroidia bacterium]
MCGIGGIINLEKAGINLIAGASIIGQTLRHRGPDDEGFLFFNNDKTLCAYSEDTQKRSVSNPLNFSAVKHINEVSNEFSGVFVHRRLAIIDVNESGHQPMCDMHAGIWVTYNGEIYNYKELKAELESFGYKFRTQSDTEVLLNAYLHWGNSCLEKFNGMFAFALLDIKNKKIFCARDRSGVKPFYYYFRNGVFCFASELKALRKLPFVETSLNERALHHYLVYDAIEYEPEGFLKNVFELTPSHFLELNLSEKNISIKKYFEVAVEKNFRPFDVHSFEKEKSETRSLIEDAIIKRMRSDVTVGCCLSGGIDSSVISGVMGRHSKGFNAFTAVFPGEPMDESAYAAEVAALTNAKWHTVNPGEKELISDFEDLIYALDIPIWSTSTYAQFRVMKLAKENNCKVVLDGQGGDELFGGYPHYFTTYVNELLRNKQLKQAINEIKGLGNNFWISYTKENAKRKVLYNSNKKFLTKDFISAHSQPDGLQNTFSSLNENLHYDFFGGRLKTYLRCEDRCGMWHSVESRTPFADDTSLIAGSFRIPSVDKIRNGVSKYILRESMKSYLPKTVYSRKDKMGFVTPHNKWMPALLQKYSHFGQNELLKQIMGPLFFTRFNHLSANSNHLPNRAAKKEEKMVFKALVFSLWSEKFGF